MRDWVIAFVQAAVIVAALVLAVFHATPMLMK